MSEFSFSNSSKTNKILPSSFLSLHLFNMFLFIFLSPYILSLLCSFSPLFLTTLFLLALFPPPNPDHGGGNGDSPSSDSKLGFLLSVVESLVLKLSSKNDENEGGIRRFEEFPAYLDVFRAPVFEVLKEKISESGFSGEEGRESRAHVGPTENKPKGNFDQNPFGKNDDDGKLEDASPIAEENCEKECSEVLEEKFSESGYSGNDDRRESSRYHVGPQEKEPSFNFDENPFEKDKGKQESARPIAEENKFCESDCSDEEEGRTHVDLIEDPSVNLEEKPAGEEEEDDDVDKVGKNTQPDDMFCQKRDKEVKPLDTDSNKAAEESKEEKMTLMRRSGSKVMCNDTANSEEEEEYFGFGSPERYWEYNRRRRRRSYGGSMRKEKEWRRTLAFKLYEERRNNVDDHGSSSGNSEAMDLLWETYEDTEHDKVKEKTSKSAEDNDDCEDEDEEEEEEEEEEEKEKGMESKYCCLQALKFSSGKMNLGMRKPSWVKISKALTSIGFLQHVRSKNGRKKIH